MAVGPSGRIVVDVDPDLKHDLHAALEQDGVSLKQWFIERAKEHLRGRGQLTLPLMVSDGNAPDRKYR